MGTQSFKNYSQTAQQQSTSNLEVAGRYAFQDDAERKILPDVVKKLSLASDDRLLEIGCGPGNLLVPLSYMVGHAVGIDNEAVLTRLKNRGGDALKIQCFPGNFLEMDLPDQQFTKILVYSVIQLMDSVDTVFKFIDRALSLLGPGGVMLLGDIPNIDKKNRWSMSPAGKASAEAWKLKVEIAGAHPMSALPVDNNLVVIDDNFILGVVAYGRSQGFESYLFSQPSDLPFGNTREDILFCRAT